MDIKSYRPIRELYEFFLELGKFSMFIKDTFRNFFRRPFENLELMKQCYNVGYKSITLIGLTALIMGVVLTLQTRPVLADFGAEAVLPGMISLSIIREIGPVITALLAAGKISSGFGAEIASMRITEQIDAMEVSGTNPIKFIVVSRVLATTFMLPVLTIFADFIGIYGSYIAINFSGNISRTLFTDQAINVLSFEDIVPAFIKTFIFGFFIGIIGCYKGYYANKGTESVGVAANTAVVVASISIFIIDLFAVQISELF